MPQRKHLAKGTKVMVYHNPLAEKDEEGRATIKVFKYGGGEHNGRLINWYIVRFDDGQLAVRKILEKSDEKASSVSASLRKANIG